MKYLHLKRIITQVEESNLQPMLKISHIEFHLSFFLEYMRSQKLSERVKKR
jgi:hypothetical protein